MNLNSEALIEHHPLKIPPRVVVARPRGGRALIAVADAGLNFIR
jgi:hypothetical protein